MSFSFFLCDQMVVIDKPNNIFIYRFVSFIHCTQVFISAQIHTEKHIPICHISAILDEFGCINLIHLINGMNRLFRPIIFHNEYIMDCGLYNVKIRFRIRCSETFLYIVLQSFAYHQLQLRSKDMNMHLQQSHDANCFP